jgi:hypothetical protein
MTAQKAMKAKNPAFTSEDRSSSNVGAKSYLWIKYLVYFWTIRLGSHALWLLIPLCYSVWRIISQTSGPTPANDAVVIAEPVTWHPSMMKHIKSEHANPTLPYLIRKVPLIDAKELDEMISFSVRSLTNSVKVSNQSHFSYFSSQALWSSLYKDSQGYKLAALNRIWKYAKFGDSINENDESFLHWYLSQPIPASIQSAWLSSLSPSFQQFIANRKNMDNSYANVLLWLSSSNITVRFHYDMEVNYYLQLSGSKTFLLAPPAARRWLRPHSSFHPQWRQAQASLSSANISVLEQSGALVKVKLEAGDLLLIPPFYFHQVIAGDNSSSVSAWFPSKESMLYTRLIREIRLPFRSTDAIGLQLASVAHIIRTALDALGLGLGNRSDLIDLMLQRYEYSDCDAAASCSAASISIDLERCHEHELTGLSLGTDVVSQASSEISSILNQTSVEIAYLLLMDYLEDNLRVILTTATTPSRITLTPSTMRSFIRSCLG